MIFKEDVKKIVETFIRSALIKHTQLVEALLEHPKLDQWYEVIAGELSTEEARLALENKPFYPIIHIQHWAAGFVQHCIENATSRHEKEIQAMVDLPKEKS